MGHFAAPDGQAYEESGKGRSKRPNVIWLFGDQHRHHAQGFAGDPNLHTPNIDDLARFGVTWMNGAVSGYPLCCPFRGSLLSGRWPHRCVPVHEAPFPDGMPTVAQPFNEAGYHTAWFGKWHVDGCQERDGRAAFWIVPPERRGGFQTWEGYENNNSQFDCWVHGGSGDNAYLEKLDGFETDVLTDRFIRFMEQQTTGRPEQPFFAALSVQPPHWPEQAPNGFTRLRPDEVQLRPNCARGSHAEATARFRAPGYYGLIENWDMNIGRVVQALRRLGISQDTHIVYFADHGEMLGSHGHMGKVLPYEESIRIPCIIGGADHFYQGSRRDQVDQPLMNHVDFAPTSLGLAGIDIPEWMEGTDYSYLRLGGEPGGAIPDSAYIQAIEPREGSPAYRALVTNDGWKYAATDDGSPWCLFDLNDDPFEQHNLARIPSVRSRQDALHDRLLQWARNLDDPWPGKD